MKSPVKRPANQPNKLIARHHRRTHSESGFTLVETMISLLILSISSGLLVQSISFASRQINTSRTLIAAEQLAISVLANHALLAARDGLDARLDPVSGLYWRSQKRTANRADENAALASVDLIIVEISLLNTAPPLYRIKTLDTTKTLDTNNPLDSLANAP